MKIQVLNGQSNYDLCLQTIGSLDSFVSLLSSNSLNTSSTKANTIQYNTNNVLKRLISGNVFSTLILPEEIGGIYGDGYGGSYS